MDEFWPKVAQAVRVKDLCVVQSAAAGIAPATYKQRKSDIKNGQASGSVMAFYDSIVGMLERVGEDLRSIVLYLSV